MNGTENNSRRNSHVTYIDIEVKVVVDEVEEE